MKQNSRGAALMIPLILLASATLIIISFFIINNFQQIQKPSQAIPTINSTANWKTYINKEYGFRVDYPAYKGDNVAEICKGYPKTSPGSETHFIIVPGSPCGTGFRVEIHENPNSLSALNFWKNHIVSDAQYSCDENLTACERTYSHEGSTFVQKFYLEHPTIDNIESIKVISSNSKVDPKIYANRGEYVYIISYNKYQLINSRILSTFNFLE